MKFCYLVTVLIFGCSTNSQNADGNQKRDSDKVSETQETCDSIPKKYLDSIKFPFSKLDSLREIDIDTKQYLKFSACDNLLFKNDRTDIQTLNYISIQDTIGYYVVLVFRQMDMENCLFIYSISKNNRLVDSEILFCETGGLDRQSDVLIDGKIVTTLTQERKAIFYNSKYVSSDKEYYSIKDTVTRTVAKEIGRQKIIEYQLDEGGQFKIIKKDLFEKEYANVKYWYN